jgi:hypothetical protein
MVVGDNVVRTVVLIGSETPALYRLAPVLQRADLDVRRFPRLSAALEFLATAPADLVVARYPLAELGLDQLLGTLRRPGAASCAAGLMLLADPDAAAEVAPFIGRGVNRVVALDAPSDRVLDAMTDLLAVAPRQTVRAPVHLELWLDRGLARIHTVTENLSTSGMLLRGGERFSVGAQVSFDLFLPGDDRPVHGEAQVARRSDPSREGVEGIAARILSFDAGDRARVESFLAQH